MYNNLQQQQPYYFSGAQPQLPINERGAAGLDPRSYSLASPQQWAPTPVQPMFLKGRPVASIDEARVAQIDLDGSLYLFPDLSNHKIYTKSINIDGTATFNVYTLDETKETAAATAYVTKAELEAALAQFKSSKGAGATQSFNI